MLSQAFVSKVTSKISLRKRTFSLLASALLGLALVVSTSTSHIEAASIQQPHNETSEQFSLSIIGGDFDLDDSHKVSKGTTWPLAVNITEDAGTVNDVLAINGSAQYKGVPYIFNFNFAVDSDDYAGGNHSLKDVEGTYKHSGYTYSYKANLSFTTENTWNFDDVTGYTLSVTGSRTKIPVKIATPTPTPTPAIDKGYWLTPKMLKDWDFQYDPEKILPEGTDKSGEEQAPKDEWMPGESVPEPLPTPSPAPKALPK